MNSTDLKYEYSKRIKSNDFFLKIKSDIDGFKELDYAQRQIRKIISCGKIKVTKFNDIGTIVRFGFRCKNRNCVHCKKKRVYNWVKRFEGIDFSKYVMLTLTVKNPTKYRLALLISIMKQVVKRCIDRFRKKKIKYGAFLAFECTKSEKGNTYHPHLHIYGTVELLDELKAYWFDNKLFKENDIKVDPDNKPESDEYINEPERFFRYISKVFFGENVNSTCVENIITATKGYRLIQTYGELYIRNASKKLLENQLLFEQTDAEISCCNNSMVSTSSNASDLNFTFQSNDMVYIILPRWDFSNSGYSISRSLTINSPQRIIYGIYEESPPQSLQASFGKLFTG